MGTIRNPMAMHKADTRVPRVEADGARAAVVTKSSRREHITVCVCTYKRPLLLRRLLDHLIEQDNSGRFTFSIVVVDNDELGSARDLVAEFAPRALSIHYFVEPRQNIALGR